MEENKFKRHVAYKLRIGDLLIGKPIFEQERFKNLDLGGKKIIRVNLVGNIVDKYESEGEKKYSFLTLDDGSGQIKTKSFGDDVEKTKNFERGMTVVVIGTIRNFNNETYLSPEIIKEQDPKYLLIRKKETEKERSKFLSSSEGRNQSSNEKNDVKYKILETIKSSENDGGIEVDQMIMKLRDVPPETINDEVLRLLEEGVIFEPRPGKVRWLG